MQYEMIITGLTLDPESNTPVLVLKSFEGEEKLPIWIGVLEATSIAMVIQGVNLERPMTHDLMKNMLDGLNIVVFKIEISDLIDNTYYAKIHYAMNDKLLSIDARPSDAIALGLRFKAPIFVDEKVFQKTKNTDPNVEVMNDTDEGKKMADFLNNLSMEDFGQG
ncbi:MAG: bifunctional nuclease family protein [Desulfobacterales bacterium]|nr:bifunctional nuclease family protein [Desulfobacterales bacterium]